MRADYQLLTSGEARRVQAFELRCRGASLTVEQWEAKLLAASTLAGMAMDVSVPGRPLLGFCLCRVSALRIIQVESVLVDPVHRRKGIGRGFLRKLVSVAAGTGGASLVAMVEDDNLDAHLWLKACGWICDDVKRDHYGPGRDGYSFGREADCTGKHRSAKGARRGAV